MADGAGEVGHAEVSTDYFFALGRRCESPTGYQKTRPCKTVWYGVALTAISTHTAIPAAELTIGAHSCKAVQNG